MADEERRLDTVLYFFYVGLSTTSSIRSVMLTDIPCLHKSKPPFFEQAKDATCRDAPSLPLVVFVHHHGPGAVVVFRIGWLLLPSVRLAEWNSPRPRRSPVSDASRTARLSEPRQRSRKQTLIVVAVFLSGGFFQ